MTGRALFAAVVCVAALPLAARAQVSSTGLIQPAAARQLGLERMWFTQVGVDRARGKIAGFHQHVSTTRYQVMVEFFHGGVRHTFSARPLEELGRPLRDVAVIAALDEAPPADTPPGAAVPKAKFRVVAVIKGPSLAQPDQILELPYVGDARKGRNFLITGSEILKGAQPPVISWWNPLALNDQALKYLVRPDAFTAGVDRALQNAEQEIARIKLLQSRLLTKSLPADDQLPEIEIQIVPEIVMYVTSERGMVHALDGETGRTLWTTAIGGSLHPTTAPGANDEYVAALNGSQLYMMKSSDGSVVWNRFTVSAPGAGPALSETMAFVPMINGSIEAYFVDEPKFQAGVFKSFGRVMHQPVVNGRSVAWPTDRGYVYVGNAEAFDMRFRIEAKDTIDSPPAFLAPDLVFATSLDGYIYCFTEMRGTIHWRFTTGEPISHQPVALVDTVYAITDRGNMYAINAEDGSEKWLSPGIKRFLSGNQERLYCIDTAGNLAIVNAESGGVIGTLPAQTLDLQVLNVQTDRILIGTTSGMLQCLRETGSYWPVVHYGELKQKKPAPQPRGGAKPAEDGAKPAADPFAAPAADPFAAPPAGADPFATPPAAAPAAPAAPPAADPFAPPAAGADPFGAP